ncbi:MAG: peptide chain release factor N(5)-glutamine methyltransferase [Lachnospiraceae bacterium]|nr:peptide chain release factor N(5)-glutamine methyltransferase [Lachnospiraceae bacterium]
MENKLSYRECLKAGENRLAAAGIEDAASDAWLLFEKVFQISRARYFMDMNRSCSREQAARYDDLIEKRAQRIPLQHLTETAPFMAYEFFVNEHVLIPRADTEVLVEHAFSKLSGIFKESDAKDCALLDMCTGSGCIAVSLACMAQEAGISCEITAVDLSWEALKTAEYNNKKLCHGKVKLIHSNLFEALPDTAEFDIIVSNPPYIRSEEIEGLMPEVREHEPRMALDGKEDGLYFYRKLAEDGRQFLKAGGSLLLEIGYDQGNSVPEILKNFGYSRIQVIKDLAGLDRVVIARKEEEGE